MNMFKKSTWSFGSLIQSIFSFQKTENDHTVPQSNSHGNSPLGVLSMLPDEIIIMIILYLDIKDILRARIVCHKLLSLTKDNVFWKTLCDREKIEIPSHPTKNQSYEWWYRSKIIRFTSKEKARNIGSYVWPNNDKYEGEWKNGKRDGYGIFVSEDGTYDGMWVADKQTGNGTKSWVEGDRYVGNWEGNRRYGYGVYTWPSGSMYDGYWKTVMHGYGNYAWYDGRVYEGQWNNGTMDGKGMFKFPDGCHYDGEFKAQKRHGYGIMYWHDERYEGQWVEDIRQPTHTAIDDEKPWDRFFTLNITGQKEFVKAYMKIWEKNPPFVTAANTDIFIEVVEKKPT